MEHSYLQPGDFEARHAAPAWRQRANFIIATNIAQTTEKREWEQLWARRISDRSFEVCCVPFFAYDIALGDEVETDESFIVRGISRKSGHMTFRVWLEKSHQTTRDQLQKFLDGNGYVYESYSGNLLAVDAEGEEKGQLLADHLQGLEDRGVLTYETGNS